MSLIWEMVFMRLATQAANIEDKCITNSFSWTSVEIKRGDKASRHVDGGYALTRLDGACSLRLLPLALSTPKAAQPLDGGFLHSDEVFILQCAKLWPMFSGFR